MRSEESVASFFSESIGENPPRSLNQKRVFEAWLWWRLLNYLQEASCIGSWVKPDTELDVCLAIETPQMKAWYSRFWAQKARPLQDPASASLLELLMAATGSAIDGNFKVSSSRRRSSSSGSTREYSSSRVAYYVRSAVCALLARFTAAHAHTASS
jgi:hypothetical protein